MTPEETIPQYLSNGQHRVLIRNYNGAWRLRPSGPYPLTGKVQQCMNPGQAQFSTSTLSKQACRLLDARQVVIVVAGVDDFSSAVDLLQLGIRMQLASHAAHESTSRNFDVTPLNDASYRALDLEFCQFWAYKEVPMSSLKLRPRLPGTTGI